MNFLIKGSYIPQKLILLILRVSNKFVYTARNTKKIGKNNITHRLKYYGILVLSGQARPKNAVKSATVFIQLVFQGFEISIYQTYGLKPSTFVIIKVPLSLIFLPEYTMSIILRVQFHATQYHPPSFIYFQPQSRLLVTSTESHLLPKRDQHSRILGMLYYYTQQPEFTFTVKCCKISIKYKSVFQAD